MEYLSSDKNEYSFEFKFLSLLSNKPDRKLTMKHDQIENMEK